MSEKQSRRRRHERPPAYVEDILRAVGEGAIPLRPGSVGIVEVMHEPWCRRPEGGPCTCRATLGSLRYPGLGGES